MVLHGAYSNVDISHGVILIDHGTNHNSFHTTRHQANTEWKTKMSTISLYSAQTVTRVGGGST
eukprot:6425480-Amphidinium_carterae.1